MGKLKRLFWLWIQCFKSMRNFKTFAPFLIYAILQALLLYSLINFSKSPFSSVFVPLIRKVFGEPALHYPNFYFILTPLYSQINIILSGIIGIILVAMATNIFAWNFTNHKATMGEAFKSAMAKYLVLLMIWIVVTVVTLLLIIGLPFLLKEFFQPTYIVSRIFDMVGLLFGIFVSSMFAYTTVLVMLEEKTFFQALSNTFSIFFRSAGTSFFLIAIPTAFYFPISYLSRRIDLLISKFSPETMAILLAIGIFITFISSYFQVGSITRFYLLLNETKKY